MIETTSVKSRIVEKLQRLNYDFEILSINPMFGPSLGFKNQSVACIDVNVAVIGNRFKDSIKKAGASVIEMSAEQHDRNTAITQAATHAAILSFGIALQKLNYLSAETKPIWTPPHRTLLALLARILNADPEVYRDIQSSNPYAEEVRGVLSDSLIELNNNVLSGKPEQFSEMFVSLNSVLNTNNEELTEFCHKLFE